MPLFAGLFAGLFGSIATFFATWVTKKTAFGLAAVTTFGILTVGLMAVIAAGINALLGWPSLPSWVLVGFGIFMPDNFAACVGALIAADTAAAIYKWNCENLRLMAYVS